MDKELLSQCIRHLPINRYNAEEIARKCVKECMNLHPDISKEDFEKKGGWLARRLSVYPETCNLFIKEWTKSNDCN